MQHYGHSVADRQHRPLQWVLLRCRVGERVSASAGFRSLHFFLRAAIEFESAMADVKKVVDFPTPEAFQKMGADIRGMSLEIPIAADGLAQIVAAAGQSGIATNELTKFAEMAAKVGVAWDITAGEAGESMAKLKTALGRSVADTGLLADAINHLGNNSAASAPQILDVVKRVAPMASQFGMTAEQVAALGAAMTGSGFGSEVAATSILNMGRALTKGGSATDRQVGAFKKLGLSAKTVAKSMQKDAVGTLQDVLARINKLPAETRAAAISDLFGDEARALGPLISNGKLLADTLALVSDQSKYAGSASKEYTVASKRTANALQLFKNRVNDLGISVGDALLPALNSILEKVGPIVTSVSDLAKRFPVATQAIVGITSAFIALRVAVTALRFAGLFAFGSVLSAGIGALGGASAILTGVSAGLTALGVAIATVSAPALFAVGLAVGALGAAGAWLYRNWDRISSTVKGVARALGDELKPVIDFLQPVIDPFAQSFRALGDGAQWAWQQVKELSSWFGSLFQRDDLTRSHEMMLEDSAYSTTRKIIQAFKAVNSAMFQAGVDMIQGLIDGVVAKAGELLAWFTELPSKIKAAIGRIDLTGIISWPNLNPFGGGEKTEAKPAIDGARAKGGPVRGGGLYLVGEKGPELFSPGASGMISPHNAYRAAAAGASTANSGISREVHVHVNVPAISVSGVSDPRTAAQMTVAELGGAIKAVVEAADTD
ncbi:phage tail tape measure protein [Shinella sp.]|uniref:phage tail tape measure protein n=1 Tax=Shinella sp. TaxID=1870904 RepID=UPI00338E1821